jgi:hypothetical protein
MIPLVGTVREFNAQAKVIRKTAAPFSPNVVRSSTTCSAP